MMRSIKKALDEYSIKDFRSAEGLIPTFRAAHKNNTSAHQDVHLNNNNDSKQNFDWDDTNWRGGTPIYSRNNSARTQPTLHMNNESKKEK